MAVKFKVGDLSVDPNACEVACADVTTKLTPRAMAVLEQLARYSGDVVTFEDLLRDHWPKSVTSPNAVHKVVVELRHALGGDAKYIETVPKRGYRLVAPVSGIDAPAPPSVEPTRETGQDNAQSNSSQKAAGFRLRPTSLGRAAFFAACIAPLLVWAIYLTSTSRTAATEDQLAPEAAKAIVQLAVLRFRSVDSKEESAYLADGIADALISSLSSAPSLRVVSRDVAFAHSSSNEPIQKLAELLDVRYLLDGSVQELDGHLRISVSLYDAQARENIYIHTHEDSKEQILALQDQVVADVLSALEIYLDADRLAHMRRWGTENVRAYLAAIEGTYFKQQADIRNLPYAASRLRDAIALDPGLVLAYANLAVLLGDLTLHTDDTDLKQGYRDEIRHLREAVQRIDPNSEYLPDILRSEVRYAEGNMWAQLEAQTRAQIQASGTPTKADYNYVIYADILFTGHLFREAAQFLDVYERFKPNDNWALFRRSYLTTFMHGPRRAIPPTLEVVRRFPNNPTHMTSLVAQYSLIGDFENAARYVERIRIIDAPGRWASAAALYRDVLSGELEPGSAAFRSAAMNPIHGEFASGNAYLMAGDVETGLSIWRSARPGIHEQIYRLTVYAEEYFPRAVVDDQRFQDYLDEVGIGRQWTAFLREKVAEMSPMTGVESNDPTPQVVWTRSP